MPPSPSEKLPMPSSPSGSVAAPQSSSSKQDTASPTESVSSGAPSSAASPSPSTTYRPSPYRSSKRRNNHQEAHAEEQPTNELSGHHSSHPLIFRGPPTLITTNADLLVLLNRLREVGSFAYDSEFIGEATYTPKLCLVQIATHQEVALVDPLAQGLDLSPFWKILCDESVEKIVHAGQQDIEPVVRITHDRPRNIFDTQIAAGFVGMTYPVALSKLVAELIGAKLGKSMTFTQWDARPLSSTQLKYAADDVRYLPALRDLLGTKLASAPSGGHLDRAHAEFEALCEPTQYIFNPDTYIHRVRGSGSLTPSQMRVLRELVIWRDAAARVADVPARAYLKDEILIDLSRSPVKTADKLAKVRGLPRPIEHEQGQALIAATLRGLSAPPVPGLIEDKSDEPTPTLKFKADALWSAAQALCHGYGIDPQLVTSRQEIGRLTYAVLARKPVPADVDLTKGWRHELLGKKLLALLTDGGTVTMPWKNSAPSME